MVVGSNVFNLTQFIYHFIAGRMLGKVYYGDFATIISILGIVGIIQITLGLTVVKFIASGKSKEAIANFSKWVNLWGIWAGVILGVLTIIFSPILINFLNIRQPVAFYVLGIIFFFFIALNVQRSILQGLLKFDRYVLSLFAEAAVKIILTLILIFLGMAVFGAVSGLLLGILSSLVVTRLSLSSLLSGKIGKKPELVPLFKYSLPVFIQGLALTSMYTTDLLLVKHFFSPEIAGTYASLAVLGRIAFFGASPVSHVMFPLVAKRFSHGEPYHRIFYLSILLVTGISLAVVLIYKIFPTIPIVVLFGQSYLDGAPLLWWFGVFMTFLVLAMLFTQFYLSIGKTRVVWLFVASALLQILLIWLFHADILTVIQVSIVSAALLFFSLLVYFPYHHPTTLELRGTSRK